MILDAVVPPQAEECVASGVLRLHYLRRNYIRIARFLFRDFHTSPRTRQVKLITEQLLYFINKIVSGFIGQTGNYRPGLLRFSGGAPALFVVLTTQAQGRFLDNALPVLAEGVFSTFFVQILSGGRVIDAALLAQTLRVEHLAAYV